ncbi:hypothetical protein HWV62_28378 [Athelia sp. TMB]|nr:hypothetical protein HWV62_28378 [Athelia sp. TMB]
MAMANLPQTKENPIRRPSYSREMKAEVAPKSGGVVKHNRTGLMDMQSRILGIRSHADINPISSSRNSHADTNPSPSLHNSGAGTNPSICPNPIAVAGDDIPDTTLDTEEDIVPLGPDCARKPAPAPISHVPANNNGDMPPDSSLHGLNKRQHPRVPFRGAGGENLLQQIRRDRYAEYRADNIHYPFATRGDWQLGEWLTNSSLTQAQIDSFLKLEETRRNPPSFTTARDLRNRIENLPTVPSWHYTTITIPGYETKEPMVLYYRDGLEVIKFIYSNPVFANCMEDRPYRLTDPKQNNQRVYGEFMSGDFAWEYYDRLPEGHGMIGVMGASDKTPLTVGTGNREMHPVLLSIANIHPGVRMKATSHSFVLAGYLPIPKFKGVSAAVHAALVAQVYHASLSVIVKDLRIAERDGAEMADPNGDIRINHTPLASWISDLPEMHTISCTLHNHSPTSLAELHEFGEDQFLKPHERRTRQHTLDNFIRARYAAGATADLPAFVKAAASYGLIAVLEPFWATWGSAEPSLFLTPDILHAWHKFFFDHVVSWAINMVTGPELDRRMACLQPLVGVRHWPNGVSTLKQLTGKEHRDLEKLLVPCIAGAVPSNVLASVRSIDEFFFQGQGVLIYDEQVHAIAQALHEFHHYKVAIIKAGGRIGKTGPILHFNIPKLEGMGIVTTSIRQMGAPYQYTSDITERCHHSHVKIPYRQSNKRGHHEQMVRWMDRAEKARIFGLYTMLEANNISLVNAVVQEASEATDPYPEAAWLSQVLPDEEFKVIASGSSRPTSLFSKANHYSSNDRSIAFTVANRPHKRLSIAEASTIFHLPDLRGAMGDFDIDFRGGDRGNHRRSTPTCSLDFEHVKIWHSFRMQQHSTQDTRIILPPRTVQALPVSPSMPYGRGNVVMVKSATGSLMSDDSEPCKIIQIRLIFSPSNASHPPPIYFYGHCFRFLPRNRIVSPDGRTIYTPEPVIDMFVVERHIRANGDRMGDIFQLTDIREILELVPCFGKKIPAGVDCNNSLNSEDIDSYYINNFSDKETFHAVLSYQ